MNEYYEGPSYGIRDTQQEEVEHHCEDCGCNMYPDDTVYELDGKNICVECFEGYVDDLLITSPGILADRLGIFTHQIRDGGLI